MNETMASHCLRHVVVVYINSCLNDLLIDVYLCWFCAFRCSTGYCGHGIGHVEHPTVLLFGADRWRIYIPEPGVLWGLSTCLDVVRKSADIIILTSMLLIYLWAYRPVLLNRV